MRRLDAAFAFCAGWALLPLAFAEGFGNAYTEPKLAVLLALALVCLASLVRQRTPPRLGAFAAGTAALLLWRLATGLDPQNPGTCLQTLALDACALAVALFVANRELSAERLAAWAAPTTALVLAGILPMILWRVIVASQASPFGSTIGWRNSLSVFLAQAVPLLLVLAPRGRGGRSLARTAGLAVLLSALLWVVIASRTRSAWWMVAITLAGVATSAARLREHALRRSLAVLAGSLVAGAALLALAPNALEWRTRSPYLESLATMASPRHSNGRVELWRVGAAMIADAPLLGVGTGSYPVLWREWIARTDVDPMAFGFLRADLPAFNDYLQDAIEGGLPGGLASLAVRLGLPLLYLWRIWRLRDARLWREALLGTGCAATAFDALVDYPFGRPETLLVFTASLALVERGLAAVQPAWTVALPARAWRPAASALAAALAALLVLLGVGLGARKLWYERGDVAALRVALRLWPWDEQWKQKHLRAFARAGDSASMERLVAQRLRAWPHDPESYVLEATSRAHRGEFTGAVASFRRAVVTVPGGRCYALGHIAYRRLLAQADFPADAPRLTDQDLAACQRPKGGAKAVGGS